jgi:hypothetical protein
MNAKLSPIAIMVLFLLMFNCVGCKKEEEAPPANNTNTNNGGGGSGGQGSGPGSVYICGAINAGGFTDWYPRYWKDGEEHIVGDGSRGHAYDIWVNEDHVYIVGNVYDGGLTMPCYWVDGEVQELNNYACGDCSAEDVFVTDAGDVYAAGHIRIDNQFSTTQKAMYWHNGVGFDLTDGSDDARANGVFVDNGNIYVCGYEADGSGGRKKAKYWLNGEPVVLGNDDDEDSEATGIVVKNGNVYVSGYEEIELPGTTSTVTYAVVWINGEREVLEDTRSEAHDIFVDGNDVYVVGGYAPFVEIDNYYGCYWKNDLLWGFDGVLLAANGTMGTGIFVYENKVHCVENYFNEIGQSGRYIVSPDNSEDFLGDQVWGIHIY